MATIGEVKDHGFDQTGCERRERLEIVLHCPRCGGEYECWSETESWAQRGDGLWQHEMFGPAQAVCEPCHILLVCGFEGTQAYRLSKADPAEFQPVTTKVARKKKGKA